MRVLPALLLALAGGARAQAPDLEAFAQALVDHPLAAHGDRDGQAREVLALLREQPGSPLAEAALRLLELQLVELDDPRALAEEVSALDGAALRGAGLSPMAARQLQRLQGLLAVAWAPVEDLGPDLFGGWLSRFMVLGPLPDAGDPLLLRANSPEFSEPGWQQPHAAAGLSGAAGDEVRWQPLLRSPLRPCVMAESVIDPAPGWALLAAAFDAPGGPAFIEVETSAGGGAAFPIGTPGGGRGRSSSSFGGMAGSGAGADVDARAYALSLNGEPAVVVDPRGLEAAPLRHHAVVLRKGCNRLMLAVPLGERSGFALRVLGADGWPLPLLETPIDAPLGVPVGARPPGAAPARSVDVLASRPARGADSEALYGLLLGLDGLPAEGLAHLRAALELAPERDGLRALLARRMLAATYLPDTQRRNGARELAEVVVEHDSQYMAMALQVAGLLADEDREAEAVARLTALVDQLPGRSDALLQLATVYRKLDMEAQAEDALRRAVDRTPERPETLRRLAEQLARRGRRSEGVAVELSAVRAGGASARNLQSVAQKLSVLGRGEAALDLLREAVARDDAPASKLALAGQLADLQRLDEADALLARLQQDHARWVEPVLVRAHLAARRSDADGERARLHEALLRQPSLQGARERLAELGEPDPVDALFRAQSLDLQAARLAYVEGDAADSVVKVVDAAVVWIFEDGSRETLTQDLYHVRDLQGCEQLGELRLSGDVLRVATIKPDGTEFEPVRVSGSYVMPDLQPGDYVLSETRSIDAAPPSGVVRVGSWYFASDEQAFRLSRYVVRVPDALPLRLEQGQLEGVVTHAEQPDGDARLHVFEACDRPRVLAEPHVPPRALWLPWIEFGMDADVPRHLAQLALGAREPTRVTPEVRAAAADAIAGLSGDEARARALHAFVNQALDRRGWQGAAAGLLGREGNASYLYAALLEAAGVPHELVWSRGISPDADPEPDPPFVEDGYWAHKLLLLVQPSDGPAAFCDMDSEALPYGRTVQDAPGAPAVALPSRRLLTLPDAPLDDRPTFDFALDFTLAADGSAQVHATAAPRGGLQWVFKESLREAPAPVLKNWVQQVLAGVVPRLDLQHHELPGLSEMDVPLTIVGDGRVAAFLDDDGRSLSCRLPFPPLQLSAGLAGGEGERRLPYQFTEPLTQLTEARLTLGDGLTVAELPAGLELPWKRGRYELSVRRDGEHAVIVRRQVALPPFTLQPAEYADLAAFCARVDEAERGRLRLARGGVDPEQGGR